MMTSCEETFAVWGPALKSSYKHSGEYRRWWRLYVYQNVRNEIYEVEMLDDGELISSGMRNGKGFLHTIPKEYVMQDLN